MFYYGKPYTMWSLIWNPLVAANLLGKDIRRKREIMYSLSVDPVDILSCMIYFNFQERVTEFKKTTKLVRWNLYFEKLSHHYEAEYPEDMQTFCIFNKELSYFRNSIWWNHYFLKTKSNVQRYVSIWFFKIFNSLNSPRGRVEVWRRGKFFELPWLNIFLHHCNQIVLIHQAFL